MIAYWLMFLTPALFALTSSSKSQALAVRMPPSWIGVTIVLSLLVGWRYQVGGDWIDYLEHYREISGISWSDLFKVSDPGYRATVWAVAQENGGVETSNLIFGSLFSLGLVIFCRAQRRPWLALAVAVPYLVIVVGMGYTRQSVALAFAMLALVALSRGRTLQFAILVCIGALFHRTAVLLIPLAILSTSRGRVWTAVWISITALLMYSLLLADSVDDLIENYLEAEYQSEGATIRVAMNVLPAVLLLRFRGRFDWSSIAERNLWTIFAILGLGSAAWLVVSSSSTAVDRMALYLIPLQLFVFSRIPDVLSNGRRRPFWIAIIVSYYAVVLLIWLSFASHAFAWIPYHFYPWMLVTGQLRQ